MKGKIVFVFGAAMLLSACGSADDSVAFETVQQEARPADRGKVRCDDEPGSEYIADSPDACSSIRFFCAEGFVPFFNECGCGCAPAPCEIAGCSGQVCAEPGEEVLTTCEYRPEYACYLSATCERQNNGACGWTMDRELRQCLRNPPY